MRRIRYGAWRRWGDVGHPPFPHTPAALAPYCTKQKRARIAASPQIPISSHYAETLAFSSVRSE